MCMHEYAGVHSCMSVINVCLCEYVCVCVLLRVCVCVCLFISVCMHKFTVQMPLCVWPSDVFYFICMCVYVRARVACVFMCSDACMCLFLVSITF